jgi:hypothetical protein
MCATTMVDFAGDIYLRHFKYMMHTTPAYVTATQSILAKKGMHQPVATFPGVVAREQLSWEESKNMGRINIPAVMRMLNDQCRKRSCTVSHSSSFCVTQVIGRDVLVCYGSRKHCEAQPRDIRMTLLSYEHGCYSFVLFLRSADIC